MKSIVDTEIQDIPSLDNYPDILEAMEKRELVIFTGAGVSRLVGCKSWDDLAYDLLKKCFDLQLLNYHEFEVIQKYNDQKKKISIAYSLLTESHKKDFFEVFNNSLKFDVDKNKKNIYDYLSLLADTFVTTNSDTCFDGKFIDSDIVYNFDTTDKVTKHKLYHIHGVNKDENSLVFTSEQYLNRYNNIDSNGNRIKFLQFLNHLFSNYTVLFMGYGLAEFELLDYLTLKSKSNFSKKRHYALMPYFSFEKKIYQHDQLYYDTLNITIIPYAKDIKGYNQLTDIADKWSNKNNYLNIIDTELQSIFSKTKIVQKDCLRITEIISRDEAFLRDFLSLCNKKPEFTVILLPHLYKQDFFKPNKNCDFWSILSFLSIYIDFCKKTNSCRNIGIYKKIIEENIDNFENRKSNFRTDNTLLELIFSLDEKYIEQKHIDFLKNVFSTTDISVASFTLLHQIFPKIMKFKNKDFIKQVVEIVFSHNIDETKYPRVYSKIDYYAFKEIAEKYSEGLFKHLGINFIRILYNEILTIPLNYDNLSLKNYNSKKPVIIEHYIPSLFNITIWVLNNFEDKENVFTEIKEKNPDLQKLLEETLNKTKENYKDPYENYAHYAEPVYSDEDVKQLTIDQILNLISKAKSKDIIEKSETNSIIQNWIVNTSKNDKYVFEKFLNIDSYFSNSILSGLCTLARENKIDKLCNIQDILDYIEQKLDSFIKDRENDTDDGRYNSFCIRNICSFISDYMRNNLSNVEKEIFISMTNISIKIYENLNDLSLTNGSSFGLNSDYLNSESGACFEALFLLYAYSKEVLKDNENAFITVFDKEVNNTKSSNFLVMLGKNLPYFFYYDENWLKKNLKTLINKDNRLISNSIWAGFYYTNYNISSKLYMYLKDEGLLDNLIESKPEDSEFFKKMSDVFVVMYLQSVEKIEKESLLLKMIQTKNISFIDSFIDSFIFRKKTITGKYEPFIINIWAILKDNLEEDKQNPEYEGIIIKLLHFIELVTNVDETTYKLLHFSVRKIPHYRVDHFLVPKLLELYENSDSSREKIEKIIIDFGTSETFFSDYDDSFSKLFTKIKDRDLEVAKEIANIYMKNQELKYLKMINGDL